MPILYKTSRVNGVNDYNATDTVYLLLFIRIFLLLNLLTFLLKYLNINDFNLTVKL